jgi:hypothetical protein
MTDKVREQLLTLRTDPQAPNMFDTIAVQRLAYEKEFFGLVLFIEEHKQEYAQFILHGASE